MKTETATQNATTKTEATATPEVEENATQNATPETESTSTPVNDVKKGFFEQDIFSLEIATDNDTVKAELSKYSQEELWAFNDDRFLVVKIPQFRGVNAHISRSVSRKTGSTFYSCDLFINSPIKHKVSSELFDEGLYQDLLLRNSWITSDKAEFDLPCRIRFIVGRSEKSLREDKLYFGIQIIFPGLNRIYTDFVNAGELDRINYLSIKPLEECTKQKIMPWNKSYILYFANNELVKNLWDLEQPDYKF